MTNKGMKSGWYVISFWNNVTGKMFAQMWHMQAGENLKSIMEMGKKDWEVMTVSLCTSRQAALDIANDWNDGWSSHKQYQNMWTGEE